MTKANPQPSTKKKTQKPVFLEIWYRVGRIKSRIACLKVNIEGRFLMRLSKLFYCDIQ